MDALVILIPTLDRPDALGPLARNIAETSPAPTVFILDIEDRESREVVRELPNCRYLLASATFPVKMNAGVVATSEPLILAAADDVVFHSGWYEAAVDAFADPDIAVIGGPDLSPITADRGHVTMPLVRRSYLDDPGGAYGETGTIFHEGYHHGWVETELWQLARHRGVAKFVPESVIEHLHPDWGTREPDATDLKGNAQNKTLDQALFNSRRAQWAR